MTTNNLKNVTATFPLGLLIGVTGVSGSGKSSLINETLAPALVRRLGGVAPKPGPHTGLRGVSQIDKVISIDQSPLGRSPRSNAATYTGRLRRNPQGLRRHEGGQAARLQSQPLQLQRRRRPLRRVPGARHEAAGDELPARSVRHLSRRAKGKRFNRQTLAVRFKGLSIADVLDLPDRRGARASSRTFPRFTACSPAWPTWASAI